jgi:16S rRNA (cytosine967-C5)-methyltransferase
MRDGGRISAAISVLEDIEARHKPAHLALKAWGDSARYAGAKDRAFVAGLVLDTLRRRRSAAWMMGEDTDRARVLGVLRFVWDWPAERIGDAADGAPHGPGALTDAEQARLEQPAALDDAPAPVRGDYPDWLDAPLARVFGDGRVAELAAMAARAPVDVRANTLKTDAAHVLKALAPFHPVQFDFLADAIRIAAPEASERAAPVEAAPSFAKGWFEVQDAGSQIAAAVAGDIRGRQVLDFCAGGGGKTLALAAAMANTGQLYAYDSDARRLAETAKRAQRAGVRSLQVRSPIDPAALTGLEGRMDLVFVDAPCTGSGTWRRHPDAKWRLTEQHLERRIAEQDAVLTTAAPFVKPGGRLIYVTCSLLAEENEDRVTAFVAAHSDFGVAGIELAGAGRWATPAGFLRLTPRSAATDGFFVAVLTRRA